MCVLSACTSHSLQNAQGIVVKADSLWKVGQIYEDSTQLAQACEELGYWRMIYPNEYAHACYHYGRLLRQKEDPVAAMQVFINAAHSRTRDYHFLGRVYNNIGDMCHRAGEYALSYDMFEQSANMYLRDGDTLSYYYCLNDMAFELAEQGKKDSCFFLINTIDKQKYNDSILIAHCYYSLAKACLKCRLYDSAIYYAHFSKRYYPLMPATTLKLAQAYSYLGKKDSAAYYALKVTRQSTESLEICNALYILTNDDETKDKKGIREVAADRADTQKLLEIRQGKLSQAVQLLEQDLERKPDLAWLYAILVTLLLTGISLSIYISRKRKQRKLLSQQIHALETRNSVTIAQIKEQVETNCSLFASSPNIKKDLCWNDYGKMCEIINQHFHMLAAKLLNKHVLNETEMRLCILVLLNSSRIKISETLPYALNSVGKLKDHTAKLLGTTGKNLHDFLIKMTIEE